jgi:hypothetical protein
MGDSNVNMREVVCAGKLKTQTFKQLQPDRLIKSGTVILASKLAETKELELQRVRDFEVATTDEERHRSTFAVNKDNKTRATTLTRAKYTD